MATTSVKESITEIRKVVNVANALRLASVCVLCYTFGSFMSNFTNDNAEVEEYVATEQVVLSSTKTTSLKLSPEKLEVLIKVADLVSPKVKPGPNDGLITNAQFNSDLKLAKTAELISLASTPGNPVYSALGELSTNTSTKLAVDQLANAYKEHKASKSKNAKQNAVEQHIASTHLLDM